MSTDTMGGVWMYALELARALSRYGVQVILATMGGPVSAGQRREVGRIPGLVLCESRYRLEWMEAPWRDVDRAGRWLLQLERRYRPDIIHLNHYSHGHLEWRAPCLVVGHSCVVSWWQAVLSEDPPTAWDTYRERVRRGLQGTDQVVAPSHTMLASLVRNYGPLPYPVVVHNGRTPADYRGLTKSPYVLSAGRLWDAAKNLETLMRVAPALEWPVYLAGEARHPDGGDAVLRHVRTLGQIPPRALARRYAEAGIYVLPARYEPFGLSVLEAALAGCVPVIGDIDSLRELWDGAACFVSPDDPDALTATVNGLIHEPRRRRVIAGRARRRALSYGTEHMVRGYLQLYEGLLSRRGATAVSIVASSG